MNIFSKSIDSLINYIFIKYSYQNKKFLSKKIFKHFYQINFFIKIGCYIGFFILNFFSIIYFLNLFKNLEYSKKDKLFQKVIFPFNFLTDKIIELLHALLIIHYYNTENLKKKITKKVPKKNFYKFIVIGSGPSGSITGYELNKKFPNNTLIVEKGNFINSSKTKHPGDEFLKKWNDGGINTTFFPNMVTFSSGNCFGGGSEINSGLYHKPDKSFINIWKKKFKVKDFDFKDIKKNAEKIEKKLNLKKRIEKKKLENYFINGIKKSKSKYSIIPRLVNRNQTKELSTMTNTYLKDYINENGHVKINTQINSIKFQNNHWILKGKTNKKNIFLKCEYLFICCGSIYTNQMILENLRIANKKILKQFKLHPMLKIVAKYPKKVQKINQDVHPIQVSNFYPKYIIGNAASSPQFILSGCVDNSKIYKTVREDWEYMSVYHCTYSTGSGRIIKVPIVKNFITLFDIKKKDLDLFKSSLKNLCNIIFLGGADYIISIFHKKKVILNKKTYIKKIDNIKSTKDLIFSSVHILGGVTMGEDKKCISNSYGKIKEYKNIYVNDSSLINTKLLKNPQGIIMAIALRNVTNFIKDIKEKL